MSGSLTDAQIRVEVRAALGNRVDAQLTDTRVVNACSLAQQRISRFYPFPELRASWTVQGVVTGALAVDKWLQLPPGVRVIHSLLMQDSGNSRKVIEKPWRYFDYQVPLPEFIAPDWPSYYTRFDLNTLMLYPIPLSSYPYFMRATMLPTVFPLPTANNFGGFVSDFTDKDDIIIALAAAQLLRTYGRPDMAVSWEQEALLRLAEAKASAEQSPDMDFTPDELSGSGGVLAAESEYWASPFIMAVEGG